MFIRDPEKTREYHRRWRAANREKRREYAKRDYEKHKDRAAANNRRWRMANPEKARAKKRRYALRHPEVQAIKGMTLRAARAGVPFTLTRKFVIDLLAPMVCSVTGVPLQPQVGRGGPGRWSPTIDRIVPECGYVPGNVRLVCHSFNVTRQFCSDAEACERVLRRRLNCRVKRLGPPLA